MNDSEEKVDFKKSVLTGKAWDIPMYTGREGTGNWGAYSRGMDKIYSAAEKWKAAIGEKEKLWLCWNVGDSWCLIQQKMILDFGWTPVIGWDPNISPRKRTVLPDSIEIDFNSEFNFPALWPHFPLEFSFLWCDRLAFWHADLLLRKEVLTQMISIFESLNAGEMAAVRSVGGLRNMFKYRHHRYWELIGCTTRETSKDQFEKGCGWWRHFYRHPNTPENERNKRERYYYDSGVGIMYWKRRYNKTIIDIDEALVSEGHCSEIGSKNYKKGDSKAEELNKNFDLVEVVNKLGLNEYL